MEEVGKIQSSIKGIENFDFRTSRHIGDVFLKILFAFITIEM